MIESKFKDALEEVQSKFHKQIIFMIMWYLAVNGVVWKLVANTINHFDFYANVGLLDLVFVLQY